MRTSLVVAGAAARRRTGGGGGGISVAQADTASGFSGSGATVTLPFGVGDSSKVVIALRVNNLNGAGNGPKTVTPPSGFSLDGTATEINASGTKILFYSRSGFTGSPTSFGFTWSDGDSGWSATIVEATGLGAFSQVVGQEGSFGNSAGGHSIGVTTPAANSLALAHIDLGSSVTVTGTSPAVAVEGVAGFNDGVYGIYPSAGANTVGWTYSANSQAFYGAAVYAPA